MPDITYQDMYPHKGRVIETNLAFPQNKKIRIKKNSKFALDAFGGDIVLDDDYDYTVENSEDEVHVVAYLVRNTKTRLFEVLIDEIEPGPGAVPYEWDDGEFEQVLKIWFAKIPAGTTTTEDLKLNVARTIPFANDEEDDD